MSEDQKEREEAQRKMLEELAKTGGPRITGTITSGGDVHIATQQIIINNSDRRK